MRYYLSTMMNGERQEKELTEADLPVVCLNLSGGGWNPKQTTAAIVLMHTLKEGAAECRRFDNRGREWVLTSVLEESDIPARRPYSSWRKPECVATDRADARARGLRFYTHSPCLTHPECAVREMSTSRCPICTYRERRAARQGQKS